MSNPEPVLTQRSESLNNADLWGDRNFAGVNNAPEPAVMEASIHHRKPRHIGAADVDVAEPVSPREAAWLACGGTKCHCHEPSICSDCGCLHNEEEPAATEALRRLDLRCYYYVGSDYRPRYDGCPANNRPRNGRFAAEQWCLPCEVRDALAATASPQPASPGEGER